MDFFSQLLDFFLSLDQHLSGLVLTYGAWIYGLVFLIVFAETGLVITPFLPGDSLIFAIGALAAKDLLNIWLLFTLLFIAAVLGDAANYWFGRLIGPKVFRYDNARFFKKEYLMRTHKFYGRHGSKAIILARFLPIIRTFAPFVAGIGHMNYSRFTFYNVAGALLWVVIFLGGGFLFGNVPFVEENFTLVILIIIATSLLPGFYEYATHRFRLWRAKKLTKQTELLEATEEGDN